MTDGKEIPGGVRMFLVVGSDSYLVEERVSELLSEIDPSLRTNEFALEKIDGAASNAEEALVALERVSAALAQTSFFAENKTVWLRAVSFAGKNARTTEAEDVKRAVDVFRDRLVSAGVPDGTTLVVSGDGIAKNSLLYNGFKKLEKAGTGKILDAGGGDATSAKRVVDRILAATGRKMSSAVLSAFVSRVGNDAARLRSECEKLFAYTAGKEPTADDVSEICTLEPNGVAWEIQSAFGSRDLPRTLAVLHKLLSMPKASEIYLARLLLARLADIDVAVAAREKGLLAPDGRGWKSGLSGADAEAVRDLGAADPLSKPPFQKLPVLENAARWTVPAVRKARLALMRGHEYLVSSSAPPSTVLELAICEALS